MSVPDDGYSRNTSCALNSISTFVFLKAVNVIHYEQNSRLELIVTLYSDSKRACEFRLLRLIIIVEEH